MSFKSDVEAILKEEGFIPDEHENVFNAMSKILDKAAQRVETNEPHAKGSIKELMDMAYKLSDREDFIQRYSYETD